VVRQAPSTEFPDQLPVNGPVDEGAPEASEVLLEDQRVPLRLTASHGTLGLELYEGVEIGPLGVVALTITLPGLKFPLDLSGGVPKFRHRRGELAHLTLDLPLVGLERWIAPRVGGLLDAAARAPTLWVLPSGIGVGLVGQRQALAFELLWAPEHADARWVVANARAVGLDIPALGLALRVVDSALGRLFEREGRVLRLTRVGERIGRLLLPAVGARAPAASAARFVAFSAAEGHLGAVLDASAPEAELGVDVLRALDLARVTASADDDLARGETERARAGYMTALERAPRHPELVRIVAEIDAKIDGRTEAALALLVESVPATQAGMVGAELLCRTSDLGGARQAVEHAVRHEPFAPLGALSWLRLAELDPEPPSRFLALDRAVAQAPGLTAPRFARFEARVGRGDLAGALADAEHLEASERGARARHRSLTDAARRLLDAGFVREAGRIYERALRYLPDDAAATAGLARALSLAGRSRRALALLERAVALSERAGEPDADALIDLAKTLADAAGDLPQAVARVREVSAASSRLVEARYLEGLWRARLGDRAGAALAFGRLREAIELSTPARPEWSAWLVEASENALGVDADPVQAERYLATALRLSPKNAEIARRYREAAAQVAGRQRR
jgi:tetratricopeptide (TPR) repeat protein